MSEWENFTREEFACKCGCGTNEIQDETIDVAQDIRSEVGFPLPISSGYRCPNHPVEARKSSPGTHPEGLAGDIEVSYGRAKKVLTAALNHPKVTGVGVNQKGAGRFIHVDTAPVAEGRPRPHVWSY